MGRTSYSLESHEEWCGNFVILHHANLFFFFSLLMTIFDGIKVVLDQLAKLHSDTLCDLAPLRRDIIFNLFGVFDDFSFSTKGSIEVISVGMERSNGIPMEIFRLRLSL